MGGYKLVRLEPGTFSRLKTWIEEFLGFRFHSPVDMAEAQRTHGPSEAEMKPCVLARRNFENDENGYSEPATEDATVSWEMLLLVLSLRPSARCLNE